MSSQAVPRRPKPRSRETRSTDINEGGATAAKRQRTATASTSPSSSHTKTESFGRTYSHVTVKSIVYDDDEDDVDDFFNRARRKQGRSGSHVGAYPDVDDGLDNGVDMDSIDEEATANGADDIEATPQGDGSTDQGHHTKRAKAYHAAWARTDSVASAGARKTSFNVGSSDEGDSDDSTTHGFSHFQRSKSSDRKDGKPSRRTHSPKLTPPPPVDKNKLAEIAKTIEAHLGSSVPSMEDTDDESLMALMHDKTFISELDPELARLVRGRQAGEVRKTLKERESARRLEDERDQQRRREARREELRLQDEKRKQAELERQRQLAPQSSPTSTSTTPLRAKPAAPAAANIIQTIEIDDSSADEQSRPRRPQRKAAIRSSYASRRRRDSSSPIEAVWTVRKDSSSGPATNAASTSNGSANASVPTRSPVAQKPVAAATQSTTPAAAARSATPPTEEVARLEIHMKGGEGGTLVESVQVRPTTQAKKLLDHYIEVFRDSIPQNRTSKVRLRFDGDILKDSDTMEEIGIETDEQLDVIW